MRSQVGCLVLVCILTLTGCATGTTSVHRQLSQAPDRPLPKRVLLLPVEIRVHEISAGGVVEKVDDWSDTASAHAIKYLREVAASRSGFELVESPTLTPEQKALLDQHIALYEAVSDSAYLARLSSTGVWKERAKAFDYTLGPGLEPLADDMGIDAALVVTGSDYISSAGRKAAAPSSRWESSTCAPATSCGSAPIRAARPTCATSRICASCWTACSTPIPDSPPSPSKQADRWRGCAR